MRNNDDLIGQRLSNDRQIFNKHILFDGGGERRGANGWFPASVSASEQRNCGFAGTGLKTLAAHMSKFRSPFELDEASSSKVNSITTLCFLSGL